MTTKDLQATGARDQSAGRAVGVLVFSFACCYGGGIKYSAVTLAGVARESDVHGNIRAAAVSNWSTAFGSGASLVPWMTLVIAPLCYWYLTRFRRGPRLTPVAPLLAPHSPGPRILAGLSALLGVLGIVALDGRVFDAMLAGDSSPPTSPAGWGYVVLIAASAGVGEELLVLAGPVMLLHRLRIPAAGIVAVYLALRVSYHLYEGWIAIPWVLVWGGAFLAIYWRYRLLWPLIVGHTACDILIHVLPTAVWYWFAVLLVVPLAWELWRRRPHSTAAGGRGQAGSSPTAHQ